jgi:hypothetical protein
MVPAETPLTRISMPLFNIAASGNSTSPSASATPSASSRQLRAV